MNSQQAKAFILQELPAFLEQDEEIRQLVFQLAQALLANTTGTESNFDQMLSELRRDREEDRRRWEEDRRKWEEQREEDRRKRDEQKKA